MAQGGEWRQRGLAKGRHGMEEEGDEAAAMALSAILDEEQPDEPLLEGPSDTPRRPVRAA